MSTTRGKLYGVSVGPGAPDLVTLRAARVLGEVDCIAAPALASGKRTALGIAADLVQGKPVIDCSTPMTRDRDVTARAYDVIADELAAHLDAGEDVAFLTLGDASVYSTWSYVHERMSARGYAVQVVPGVPSFCAVAARLGEPLCTGGEQLLVVPAAAGDPRAALDVPGTKVFMKAGRALAELQELLASRGVEARFVANCGLEGELVVRDFGAMEDPAAGYLAVVIARDARDRVAGPDPAGVPLADAGERGDAASRACAAGPDPVRASAADAGERSCGALAGDDAARPGSSFFQNRACPHFPCHKGVAEADFNCLLCYCPLYALGEGCGGDYRYTESGVKDCSACTLPHRGEEGVRMVRDRFPELSALAGEG